jgi:glucose/arabinose dehydrogenase
MRRLFIVFAALSALMLMPANAQVPRLPAGFTETVYEDGLSAPTSMAFAPDGRLFVTQQGGAVKVIDAGGTLLGTNFTSFTVDSAGERGLLGVAFDPNFASNNLVYFYYTTPDGPRNKVVHVTANGNQAVLGSEDPLFELPVLSSATNHNGGAIHFGADGKLYVAVGENANAPLAQQMDTRLGKMLRYNSDGTIPTDNPFYNSASGANRAIWALGLRNPFTFAVQPGTGQIFINDVGGGAFEEVNLGEAGANYGWPETEGYHSNPAYENPLYAYANDTETCAIAGGTFYNPSNATFPTSYVGDYFFADLCAREIYHRDAGGAVTTFAGPTDGGGIVDLDIGPDGALYYLSRGSGAVYRIAFTPPALEGELVRNGSFENDKHGDGIPNHWTVVGLTARRICNGKGVTDGACALRIRSGTVGGKVIQKVAVPALASGTTLHFSLAATGKNVPAGAKVKLQVITDAGKAVYTIPLASGTFPTQALSHTPIVTAAQGKVVKVVIVYPAGGGKVFVEAVSVVADAP